MPMTPFRPLVAATGPNTPPISHAVCRRTADTAITRHTTSIKLRDGKICHIFTISQHTSPEATEEHCAFVARCRDVTAAGVTPFVSR